MKTFTPPPHPADGLCAGLIAEVARRGFLAPLLLRLLAPLLRLLASLDHLFLRFRNGTLPLPPAPRVAAPQKPMPARAPRQRQYVPRLRRPASARVRRTVIQAVRPAAALLALAPQCVDCIPTTITPRCRDSPHAKAI